MNDQPNAHRDPPEAQLVVRFADALPHGKGPLRLVECAIDLPNGTTLFGCGADRAAAKNDAMRSRCTG